MSKSQTNGGTIDVDGVTYDWRLQREPHQSDDDGWKGMTISLLQCGTKREAWVEFPPSKRLLKGLPRGRLQLDNATLTRCVRAALSAGWEPTSRGKPVMFTVDADGNRHDRQAESRNRPRRSHVVMAKLIAQQGCHFSALAGYLKADQREG